MRIDREAVVAQELEELLVGLDANAVDGAGAVGEETKPALGGLFRIEQLERAGGEVARIGIRLQAELAAGFVGTHQILAGHVDLAAHLKERRRPVGLQAQGQAADGAEVVCDVVAALAVAARGAELERALLVSERNGDAVDLQLDDVTRFLIAEQAVDAAIELAQIRGAIGVVDGQHWRAVLDRLEAKDRLAAHALRRAVGRNVFGVLGFDLLQLFKQAVELAVGDFGLRLDVVKVVVVNEEAAQLVDAVFVFVRGHVSFYSGVVGADWAGRSPLAGIVAAARSLRQRLTRSRPMLARPKTIIAPTSQSTHVSPCSRRAALNGDAGGSAPSSSQRFSSCGITARANTVTVKAMPAMRSST